MSIAITLLIETLVIIWASTAVLYYRLRLTMILNLALIGMFAGYMIEIGGSRTNIGTLWYAAVVMAQCIVLERYGALFAREAIPIIYAALATVTLIVWAMLQFPALDGDPAAASIRAVLTPNVAVITGAFIAFWLSQMVLILSWSAVRPNLPPVPTMILCSWLAQCVDTPVFFIVAFTERLGDAGMVEAAALGLLVKCGAAVALIPAFVVAVLMPQIQNAIQRALAVRRW